MNNKMNNITRRGMLLGLTAITTLCMVPPVRAGGGTFYATVTNVTQLIGDINYANTNGGTFTINLQTNTTFDLITGYSYDGFGTDLLPVIGTPNAINLTILGNGDTIQRDPTDPTTYNERLLEVAEGSSLTLDQMTLQYGYTVEFNGGAIYNNGTLSLSNCTLYGNISDYNEYLSTGGKGGAIYNNAGTVKISNSTISTNTAGSIYSGEGGGIYNYSGTVTISHSIISGNGTYDAGGGIFNDSGTVTISHSTLSGNGVEGVDSDGDPYGDGGGIYNNGTVTVENSSSITGNGARDGGGILNNYGTVAIFHSTISSNSADGDGGGIYNNYGTVMISQSTNSGNSAYDDDGDAYGGDGGGLYNNGTVTVENSSSITGNDAVDFGPDVYNLGTLYLDGTSTNGVLDGYSAIGLNPALSIHSWSSTAHQLVLSWSTNYSGCTLQSSTDPGSTNWTDCASPTVSGASYIVTNSMSAGAQFFRLKQ